jgi:mono/diheme cytochrome c family protein
MFRRTRTFLCYLFISIFAFSSSISVTKAQDLADGKKTFETICSACHKLGEVLIGPDLTGVKTRWKDEKKLIAFVHNSQAVINGGDPYAKALFDKFNHTIMPPQDLSDEQIKNVLAYESSGGKGPEVASGGGAAASGGGGQMSSVGNSDKFLGMPSEVTLIILLVVVLVLLGVAILLYRVRQHLARLAWEREHQGEIYIQRKKESAIGRYWHSFATTVNPYILGVIIVTLLSFVSMYDMYHRAQDLGTQWGYSPEQPIRFNHKIHAGQYGINCQYCHNGVMKSKNAGIPPIQTCMNCHNYIKEGPQYGKTEIAKLVNYYQNQQPVKWIRIHNLPAHVYFNHAQHVNAGKLDCANCHGKVAEMIRVQQVATLEMGWCVNCHREKQVNSSNPYYSSYDFVKNHKKYTVAQMGGLECSKCHY